jgi:molybdopterin-guanine dinucleotide biosynthesis protein A
VTAAILVGGRARRLGGALKPLLEVGGRTILDRQIATLGEAGCDEILFVGHWPGAPRGMGRHVADAVEGTGALGALYTALIAAATPVVVVLAGDLPFVTVTLLQRLLPVEAANDAVVPRTAGGWHPLCAAYRRRAAARLKARLDRRELRVSDALADLRVREVPPDEIAAIDPDGVLLMNVNTPDEYRHAQSHARRA